MTFTLEAKNNEHFSTYQEACAYLESLQFFRIKLGLATMHQLLQELGQPQQRLRCIHIAGTNGKGSVGITLATLLAQAGYRAGFYSSPHLCEVRERFVINGTPISEEAFRRQMNFLHALFVHAGVHPTYFECTTLLALSWFAQEDVDVAILETGLGGRLDATNVVTPMVAVITDISRDHEQYLGTDITAIAAEKAGIIKPGVPVIFSGRTAAGTEVIASFCRRLGSRLFLLGRDFFAQGEDGCLSYTGITGTHRPNLSLALAGAHQVVNTSLALATLELLATSFPIKTEDVRAGLAKVHWPGRMEYLTLPYQNTHRRFLLEGAHNEAGVQALCTNLAVRETGGRIILVWGNMADKQMEQARRKLFTLAAHIILTQAELERSATPQSLWESMNMEERQKSRCIASVHEALLAAMALATADELICVAGSLHLVGRARHYLIQKQETSPSP
jgi:dihydrofolate synthase/folylpolyglutamate synthase